MSSQPNQADGVTTVALTLREAKSATCRASSCK